MATKNTRKTATSPYSGLTNAYLPSNAFAFPESVNTTGSSFIPALSTNADTAVPSFIQPLATSALGNAAQAPVSSGTGLVGSLGNGVFPTNQTAGWSPDWDFWLGKKNTDGTQTMGAAMPAISAASALGSFWLGSKQLSLQKDQLNFARESFDKNWEAQKATTNSQLADRQAGRVAGAAGGTQQVQSVDDYMKKWGVK